MFDGSTISDADKALNTVPIFYWNWAGLEMNRISTSLRGPQGGPTLGSRALGLLHLALHDAWFGSAPNPAYPPYDAANTFKGGNGNGNDAMAGAAMIVLESLYRGSTPQMSTRDRQDLANALDALLADGLRDIDQRSDTFDFGRCVGRATLDALSLAPNDFRAGQLGYTPRGGRGGFDDEPTHPVRLQPIDPDHPEAGMRAVRIYHGPFYGEAPSFAVTDENALELAPPPKADASIDTYVQALNEVVRLGGASDLATTERTSAQTVAGLYWAYDGSNLIGTPPRLYNQIIRVVLWDRNGEAAPADDMIDDSVRTFALCNVAMADAGKFAWREKYRFEYWRPLTGVRAHDSDQATWNLTMGSLDLLSGDKGDAHPFWRTLGAPDTNSNLTSFKPPFPAYPSGHATFGAACFQMLRLIYGGVTTAEPNVKDTIGFSFVSDELNGVSRDLDAPYMRDRPIRDQPGDVRTRLRRTLPSLKHAMFENAFSRIFLGVHWNFDAFNIDDVRDVATEYRDPADICYSELGGDGAGVAGKMTGGVPLGMAIANQIFDAKLTKPAALSGSCVAGPSATPASVNVDANLR